VRADRGVADIGLTSRTISTLAYVSIALLDLEFLDEVLYLLLQVVAVSAEPAIATTDFSAGVSQCHGICTLTITIAAMASCVFVFCTVTDQQTRR
jgi:hypothetical protein